MSPLETVVQQERLCTDRLRCISRVDSCPIKEEADTCHRFALTLAERVHELVESGCALDLEEDFVVVVGDFDVEVFGLRNIFSSAGSW